MYHYKCELVRIIDGDTIVVDVDLGFNMIKKNTHVRLLDIDAPEIRTKDEAEKLLGLKCSQYLRDTINGQSLTLKSDRLDGFGRCLGYVFIGESSVNEIMAEYISKIGWQA